VVKQTSEREGAQTPVADLEEICGLCQPQQELVLKELSTGADGSITVSYRPDQMLVPDEPEAMLGSELNKGDAASADVREVRQTQPYQIQPYQLLLMRPPVKSGESGVDGVQLTKTLSIPDCMMAAVEVTETTESKRWASKKRKEKRASSLKETRVSSLTTDWQSDSQVQQKKRASSLHGRQDPIGAAKATPEQDDSSHRATRQSQRAASRDANAIRMAQACSTDALFINDPWKTDGEQGVKGRRGADKAQQENGGWVTAQKSSSFWTTPVDSASQFEGKGASSNFRQTRRPPPGLNAPPGDHSLPYEKSQPAQPDYEELQPPTDWFNTPETQVAHLRWWFYHSFLKGEPPTVTGKAPSSLLGFVPLRLNLEQMPVAKGADDDAAEQVVLVVPNPELEDENDGNEEALAYVMASSRSTSA